MQPFTKRKVARFLQARLGFTIVSAPVLFFWLLREGSYRIPKEPLPTFGAFAARWFDGASGKTFGFISLQDPVRRTEGAMKGYLCESIDPQL